MFLLGNFQLSGRNFATLATLNRTSGGRQPTLPIKACFSTLNCIGHKIYTYTGADKPYNLLNQHPKVHAFTHSHKSDQVQQNQRGTKIEANSRNSVRNPSAEEKTTRNSILWKKNKSKLSECRSEPFRKRENNSEQNGGVENFKNSVRKNKTFEVRTNHFAILSVL